MAYCIIFHKYITDFKETFNTLIKNNNLYIQISREQFEIFYNVKILSPTWKS